MKVWKRCSRKENSQCKGPETSLLGISKEANMACVGCLLPVRPLEALNFTKSPPVTGKMNKAKTGPLPAQHPCLGVVMSLEGKVGKHRPNTSFYVSATNILPRRETLKLPLPHSSPLSPNLNLVPPIYSSATC